MHDKIVVLDGRRFATGSFNWETGARFDNHEAMFLGGDPDLVAAYAARLTALAGGPLAPRGPGADPAAARSVSFAPDEAPARVLGRLIDEARTSILVAMFTCKDVRYDGTSIFERLAAARRRGVDVRVIVDHGVHEASEYHGVETPDDPADERLEADGIRVIRADNPRGRYASMHHKLTVIDGEVVIAGAFNWYFDAAYRNDEDQLVVRDPALAARVTGELVDLFRQYDPAWDPSEWPQVRVSLAVRDDRTRWGETVLVAGDLPELGGWAPAAAIELSSATWPVWTGALVLPAGVHLRWKAIVREPDGVIRWEPGADRRYTVPVGVDEATVEATAR
jgi:phosphatidylserine/phosphatidylglycerophosphate/cardiolipin synthase-like enzyme